MNSVTIKLSTLFIYIYIYIYIYIKDDLHLKSFKHIINLTLHINKLMFSYFE